MIAIFSLRCIGFLLSSELIWLRVLAIGYGMERAEKIIQCYSVGSLWDGVQIVSATASTLVDRAKYSPL